MRAVNVLTALTLLVAPFSLVAADDGSSSMTSLSTYTITKTVSQVVATSTVTSSSSTSSSSTASVESTSETTSTSSVSAFNTTTASTTTYYTSSVISGSPLPLSNGTTLVLPTGPSTTFKPPTTSAPISAAGHALGGNQLVACAAGLLAFVAAGAL